MYLFILLNLDGRQWLKLDIYAFEDFHLQGVELKLMRMFRDRFRRSLLKLLFRASDLGSGMVHFRDHSWTSSASSCSLREFSNSSSEIGSSCGSSFGTEAAVFFRGRCPEDLKILQATLKSFFTAFLGCRSSSGRRPRGCRWCSAEFRRPSLQFICRRLILTVQRCDWMWCPLRNVAPLIYPVLAKPTPSRGQSGSVLAQVFLGFSKCESHAFPDSRQVVWDWVPFFGATLARVQSEASTLMILNKSLPPRPRLRRGRV